MSEGIGLGEMTFIGCACSWAAYTLIGRLLSDELPSLLVIIYASCIGTIVLFIVALLKKGSSLFSLIGDITVSARLHLLYLAILATVVGFVWFQQGVKSSGCS